MTRDWKDGNVGSCVVVGGDCELGGGGTSKGWSTDACLRFWPREGGWGTGARNVIFISKIP